jgi:hypothetical protein
MVAHRESVSRRRRSADSFSVVRRSRGLQFLIESRNGSGFLVSMISSENPVSALAIARAGFFEIALSARRPGKRQAAVTMPLLFSCSA